MISDMTTQGIFRLAFVDGRMDDSISGETTTHQLHVLLVSEDDSAMEVNSNAREYEPRPVLATGGGVLARLNVATSCSARKDDARRIALILVVGVVAMME